MNGLNTEERMIIYKMADAIDEFHFKRLSKTTQAEKDSLLIAYNCLMGILQTRQDNKKTKSGGVKK